MDKGPDSITACFPHAAFHSTRVMSSYMKQLLIQLLLLQLLIHEHVHTKEVTGIRNQEINITFTNTAQSAEKVKTVSLYKDSKKIGQCYLPQCPCKFDRGELKIISQGAVVSFPNLSMEDSGNYSVTFFLNSPSVFPFESGLVSLSVELTRVPTESPPLGSPESSPGSFSYVYVIIALLLTTMMLPAVLLGWVYQSPKRSRADHQQQASNDYQMSRQTPRNMQVCSVEYEVLEFHSSARVKGKAEHSESMQKGHEAVEYATITFP